jgi:CubicO group peptidase (beta-lactamase class C family)
VSVSKAYYQIASETCAYFQFDMWGLLDASYTPQVISGASQIASDHQQSLANRMPQKSIADLAIDYPGVNPNEFANPAEVSPLDLSIFGVIVDGTHYVGGCETRYGTHPYCDALRVPSYSTSKTSLAATGAMRLEKLHGDFFSQIIADWVSEAAADPQGDFNDVTINNALDMSTGNFTLPGYFDDESASASNGFFLPETYAEKIDFAVNQYPRQATPGTQMHYHTSDTFLAMTAAQSYHRDKVGFCGDVFDDVVVDDIWAPLGFDAGSLSARRTYDPVQQPIGGLGASYLRDDIAKLGQFLGVDHGRIDNVQVLEPEQLAAGKFGTAADPGLSWISSGLYNNAFWGLNRASIAGCAGLFVPYMSGFGGITIAIAPSGIVYYYFSDGYSVTWNRAFAEAEEIRSSCITGPPNPPLDLVIVEEQAEAVTLRWTPGPTPINVMRFRVYRDGVAIALTSGNEWTDNAITPGKDHVYYVEAVDVIGLVSTTGAVLTFEPGVFNIPAMPTVAAILVSLALVSVAVRRRR